MTTKDVLVACKLHFRQEGELMIMVRSVQHDYNTTVIWRDTSPAGNCIDGDPYKLHSHFKQLNEIARQAFRESGALLLDIWDATLPFYDQHLSSRDLLHYCLYQATSPQNIWIEKLMDMVLRHELSI